MTQGTEDRARALRQDLMAARLGDHESARRLLAEFASRIERGAHPDARVVRIVARLAELIDEASPRLPFSAACERVEQELSRDQTSGEPVLPGTAATAYRELREWAELLDFVAGRLRKADEKDDPQWIYGPPLKRGRRKRSLAECQDEIALAALVLERCEGDLERVGHVYDEFDQARERAIDDGKSPSHVREFFPSGRTARRAFNRWGKILATWESWPRDLALGAADAEPPAD